MTATFDKHYKAFISYSHADNKEQGRKWADWLHHSLETYQIPAELVGQTNQYGQEIPAQIYPVFQDEKELSANADLSASLQQALDHAEFLVYLSSPRSARSLYVQEEIKHFKKSGKGKNIIALIVRGEPEYGDVQSEQQCFPDALRFGVAADGSICYEQREEALAADVRLPHSSEEGYTSAEAYRRHLQQQNLPTAQIKQKSEDYQERLNLAKLKIIATILGVPLGELTQRDQAYQLERIRRKNRNIKRVTAVVSVLAVMATVAGLYAWNQKNEAQKNLAQSLYTSGINKLAQNEYGDPAAYIAAAVRSGSANATQFAESMLAIKDDKVLLPNMSAANTVFSPDGRYLAGFANQGNGRSVLQLWDARTRSKITDIGDAVIGLPGKPVFDRNNTLYARTGAQDLTRYRPTDKQSDVIYRGSETGDFVPLAVSADGQWLALQQYGQGVLTIVNTADRNIAADIPATATRANRVVFSANGTQAAVFGYDNAENATTTGELLRLEKDRIGTRTRFALSSKVAEAQFSPDGKYLLLRDLKTLALVDTADGHSRVLPTENRLYTWSTFNPDGQTLVAVGNQGYDVYDLPSGSLKKNHTLPALGNLRAVFDHDNAELHMLSPDQTQSINMLNNQAYLQNLGNNNLLIGVQRFAPQMRQVAADNSGTYVLALNENGTVIERVNTENGNRQGEFIRLPEETAYFRVLEHNLLMTVSTGKTVRFYAADSGTAVGVPVATQARAISISRDGSRFLARTGENGFAVWRIQDGKEVLRYQGDAALGNFTTDDDFTTMLVADAQGWHLSDISSRQTLLSGKDTLTSATFSADGQWLAMSTQAGQTNVYDVRTKQKRFSIATITTPLLRFSPDGSILLATEDSRRLRLWHTEDGQPYGQIIPVYADTKLLHFSADGRKLFLQDAVEGSLAPAVKIIDSTSGNLISLPFADGIYNNLQLSDGDERVTTVTSLPEGYVVKIWQVPGGQKLSPEQLAADLETFYGRKYDPRTGAIGNYDGKKQFNTWFFRDIYTRSINPNAQTTVIQAIERHLPVQNEDSLQLLSTTYFYHPLARAGLAEYFAGQTDSAAMAQRLIDLTELQLSGIDNAAVAQPVQTVLARARQHLDRP